MLRDRTGRPVPIVPDGHVVMEVLEWAHSDVMHQAGLALDERTSNPAP